MQHIKVDIYRLLPFKAHQWLIVTFGKPCKIYCPDEITFYKLGGWIAYKEKVYKPKIFAMYLEWKNKIKNALKEVGY